MDCDNESDLHTTQSQGTINTADLNEWTEGNAVPEADVWGRLVVKTVIKRTLGIGKRPTFLLQNLPNDCQIGKRNTFNLRQHSTDRVVFLIHSDLRKSTFAAGRADWNDFCFSSCKAFTKVLDRISAVHFKLSKDLSHDGNPVYIEVGTDSCMQ